MNKETLLNTLEETTWGGQTGQREGIVAAEVGRYYKGGRQRTIGNRETSMLMDEPGVEWRGVR